MSPSPVEIKSHWPAKSDSLETSTVPCWFPSGCSFQNLHNSGRTFLILLFSSLCITHLVRDMIYYDCTLIPSRCSFFVFGHGYIFGGFQCPPVYGYSILVVILVVLTGGLRLSTPSLSRVSVLSSLILSCYFWKWKYIYIHIYINLLDKYENLLTEQLWKII